MASDAFPTGKLSTTTNQGEHPLAASWARAKVWLEPLASLKLSVVLFALGVFLILAGTLAQVELDMWDVMREYFLPWVAKIEPKIFVPKTWFPDQHKAIAESCKFRVRFPGGALIGTLMVLNLLAAHAVRFKSFAQGRQLHIGLLLLSIGVFVTSWVIISGHNAGGLQAEPLIPYPVIWSLCKLFALTLGVAGIVGTFLLDAERRRAERWLLGSFSLFCVGIALWTLIGPGRNMYFGDGYMRILWQLILGAMSGAWLLAGCYFLFGKRAGIVVIHGGVLLLMYGQYFVSQYDVEEQLQLSEGDIVNYCHDIRTVELAVTEDNDASEGKHFTEVVIPRQALLISSGNASLPPYQRLLGSYQLVDADKRIQHPDLPFKVKVLEYFVNANLINTADAKQKSGKESDDKTSDDKAAPKHKVTAGTGLTYYAVKNQPVGGVGSDSKVNLAAAYVQLTEKDSDKEIGVYLVSQLAAMENVPEKIDVNGRSYNLALRFKRNYKSYAVQLLDVRNVSYAGTSTPRDYSSDIRLISNFEKRGGDDRHAHIWMNNPLRYAGETFYQSGYHKDPRTGKEGTTIQVVRNRGWMIPYVACMVVGVGMMWHFLIMLIRFLKRMETQTLSFLNFSPQMLLLPVVVGTAFLIHAARSSYSPPPGAFVGENFQAVEAKADIDDPESAQSLELPFALSGELDKSRPAYFKFSAQEGAQLIAEVAFKEFDQESKLKPQLELYENGNAAPIAAGSRLNWKVARSGEYLLKLSDPKNSKEEKQRYRLMVGPTFDIHDFARLPVLYEGRIKPFGTLAMNTLRILSTREEFKDLEGKKQPAIRWLLDTVSGSEVAEHHRVFRVDNLDLQNRLKLKRRPSFLYSLAELRPNFSEFEQDAALANSIAKDNRAGLDTYQRKVLELERRVRAYLMIAASFRPPHLPQLPTREEFESDRAGAMQKVERFRSSYQAFVEETKRAHPPLAVPTGNKDSDEWQTLAEAITDRNVQAGLLGGNLNPAVEAMAMILDGYRKGEAGEFNSNVESYRKLLKNGASAKDKIASFEPPEMLQTKGGMVNRFVEGEFGSFYSFEQSFNYAAPFYSAAIVYFCGFLVAIVGWLVWRRPLKLAAFAVITVGLVVHTVALLARIYISERPPVTNLYSSAVFIGWGGVCFGLVFELIFRNGFGNVLAAKAGAINLIIAHQLAEDGDTFTVLQAVLDTQIWLATHVVTISLGYAATFVAGFFGIYRIFLGIGQLAKRDVAQEQAKELGRMIYGTLCFAIFFSFIGTVLGGLWADDSWGRFWGWDPKENGALIIVLWNALVLHARWDGLAKDVGLATLAVLGNVVTAWSWFGVNELGAGLHSYGFTEGILMKLGLFVFSQLVLAAIGATVAILLRRRSKTSPTKQELAAS